MSIAQLGYEIDSSQAVEAERNLDRMGEAAGRAGNDAQGLEKQSSGLASTFKRLAPLAAGLAASLAGMFSARAVIGAAEQYENRMARVNAVIQATGGVAGRTAEQLEANAQALARATLESVDGVMQAQQTLLTFRNVQGEVFDRAIESAADLSAAMGQDLTSSTRQLARALEDPIQGVTALTRSGTVFTQQQRDMIRTLVESGDLLGAQNLILEELEGQYGGVAQAGAGLREAKDSLSQSFTNLLISINENLGLTDRLSSLYSSLSDNVQWLADNLDSVLSGALDLIINSFKVLVSLTVAYYATHIPAFIAAITAKVGALTLANAQLVIMNAQLVAGAAAARTFNSVLIVTRGIVATLGGPIGILFGLLAGAASAALLFRDNVSEADDALKDAKDAQDALNAALGVFHGAAAPSAAKEAVELANTLVQEATAARDAASAHLELAAARLASREEMLATQEGRMQAGLSALEGRGPDGREFIPRDILQAEVEAQREALERATSFLEESRANARRAITDVTGAMSEQMSQNFERTTTQLQDLRVGVDGLDDAFSGLGDTLGGSGGGGGAAGGEDTGLLSRFEALQDELRTQAEQVEIWYQEAQETLQWALENERITLEEHAQMKLEIERLYQEQLAAIRSQAASETLSRYGDLMGGLQAVAQQGGEGMTRIARIFGAAQALINTYVGASEALKLPFPANLAAAAKVIAAGMGFVNAIRGGGSGSGAGGAAPTRASGVTQQQTPLRRTIIELRGPDWVKGIIQPVMEQIYEASEDGQVVFAR